MYTPKPKYAVTTFTVTSYDRKVSIEIPLDSNAFEVFETFKTLMVGMTFTEQMFNDAVIGYYFEHELGKNTDDHDQNYYDPDRMWVDPVTGDTRIGTMMQDC